MESLLGLLLEAGSALGVLGIGLGIGIVVVGAGIGIGAIGGRAMEAMGRQPEIAGTIRGSMLIALAFIEGIAFFGLIACVIALFVG